MAIGGNSWQLVATVSDPRDLIQRCTDDRPIAANLQKMPNKIALQRERLRGTGTVERCSYYYRFSPQARISLDSSSIVH